MQLTWTSGDALRWDPAGPVRTGAFTYEGEGWGLSTLDDGELVDERRLRRPRGAVDPVDFSVLRDGPRPAGRWRGGRGSTRLEWDGTRLWANRYQTDEILRIDMACGVVDGVVDARRAGATGRRS